VETRAPASRVTQVHSQQVAGTAWVSSGSFATASWDGSVRVWDAEAGCAQTAVLHAGKAVTGVSASPLGSTLATSHPDHVVRLWDTRGRDGAAGELAESAEAGVGAAAGLRGTLRGAPAATATWTASVAWAPWSSHHVAAAAHDGSVRVWDIRAAAAPLFVAHKHDDQALAVAWAQTSSASAGADKGGSADGGTDLGLVVSGGADARLRASALTRQRV
jgi:WD40 repeat protein